MRQLEQDQLYHYFEQNLSQILWISSDSHTDVGIVVEDIREQGG